jgi:hypothetical protein
MARYRKARRQKHWLYLAVLLPLAAVLITVLAMTGSGATPGRQIDTQAAADACEGPARVQAGKGAILRAAFEASGRSVHAWQMTRNGAGGPAAVSEFVKAHVDDPVVVICYFDVDPDEIATPVPPDAPRHNRVRILVSATGEAALDSAGYHDIEGFGPGRGELQIERVPRID